MKTKSVSFRLRLIVVLSLVALLLIGYLSVTGMKKAGVMVEHLYTQEMNNSMRANRTLNLISEARSSLLLAFQHDPDGKFSQMHDHPVSLHLDSISVTITNIVKLLEDGVLSSDLSQDQRDTALDLLKSIRTIEQQGFARSIEEIRTGDYQKANLTLLRIINPQFERIKLLSEAFLDGQLEQADTLFEQTEENISQFILTLAVIVTLSSAVIIVLAVIIVRRVRLALSEIQTTASIVAQGDLTKRVNMSGSDELADLALNVNVIVTQFQEVVSNMSHRSIQLSSSAEESSAVALQTKHNVMDQQQQTQLVATAVHEFTSTVQEVANSAASAAEASEQADHATNEGRHVVRETINMITELEREISRTTESIKTLSENSSDIGTVVDVIDSISEQTNLLALNAAIEAARAGEAGRGFAVVADEVRSLASRTQQSTEEIKAMIQKLQVSSKESLKSMEQGSAQAGETVQMAEQAGKALDEISRSVEKINALNIQIAAAAEQQSTVTNEINQNVTSINDISIDTASGAEQTSSASLELAKLVEEIREEMSHFVYQ